MVNPLGVVTKSYSDKFRLILDQNIPNKNVSDVSCRMKCLANARNLARHGDDGMLSVDLTQGYQHELHPIISRVLRH